MRSIIYKSSERGTADHGWLKAKHSFCFDRYYHPEKMNFGALRVLNDDYIVGGSQAKKHNHENIEIVTIPLRGSLKYEDNKGNTSEVKSGEIQVMSTGSGINYSKYNTSTSEPVQVLQIGIVPNQKMVKPRLERMGLSNKPKNEIYQVLSPDPKDDGLWLYQNAWFSMVDFDQDKTLSYNSHNAYNGIYTFVINGSTSIDGNQLTSRDAIGVYETSEVNIAGKKGTQLLIMEVPMRF